MLKKILSLLPFFFFMVLCGLITYVSLQPFHEPSDMFWHVAHGKDFWEMGLGATKDRFSFTLPGHEVAVLPWIFEILSYFFWENLYGHLGLQIFRAILWIFPLVILATYFSNKKTSWYIQIFAYIYASFASVAFYWMRPELISYSFTLLMLLLFPSARKKWNPKLLLGLAFLQWTWINFHSSGVFGFVALGSLYIEWFIRFAIAFRRGEKNPWLSYFALGILTFCTGFVTPTGIHGHALIASFSFDPEWRTLIKEFIPWKFVDLNHGTQAYTILLGITLLYCILQKAWSYVILISVVFWQATTMNKIWLHMIMTTIPIVIGFLEVASEDLRRRHISLRLLGGLALLAVIVPAFHDITQFCRIAKPSSEFKTADFATDALAFMNATNRHGKVYADYELGGVITLLSDARSKVYIDGRTNILYGLDIMKNYLNTRRSPAGMLSEIQRYDMDLVLLPKYAMQFLEVLERQGNMTVVFVGEGFLLFSRREGTKFMPEKVYFSPKCVDYLDVQRIKNDRTRMIALGIATDENIVGTLTRLIYEYVVDGRKDVARFLHDNDKAIHRDDGLLRFAAYVAQRAGLDKVSADYLKQIKSPTVTDFLVMTEMNLARGFYEVAESQLVEAFKNLPPWKAQEALKYVQLIGAKSKFKVINDAQINELTKVVSQLPPNFMDFKEYCLSDR